MVYQRTLAGTCVSPTAPFSPRPGSPARSGGCPRTPPRRRWCRPGPAATGRAGSARRSSPPRRVRIPRPTPTSRSTPNERHQGRFRRTRCDGRAHGRTPSPRRTAGLGLDPHGSEYPSASRRARSGRARLAGRTGSDRALPGQHADHARADHHRTHVAAVLRRADGVSAARLRAPDAHACAGHPILSGRSALQGRLPQEPLSAGGSERADPAGEGTGELARCWSGRGRWRRRTGRALAGAAFTCAARPPWPAARAAPGRHPGPRSAAPAPARCDGAAPAGPRRARRRG